MSVQFSYVALYSP